MFSVTYLGHHGWMIGTAGTRVLVDPVLTEGFGNLVRDAAVLYPPRRIDLAALPAIDAVVLSHEHPDHLSLKTLRAVDRRVRVLLSGYASDAATAILEEMGFSTARLHAGSPVRIGDLDVHAFHAPLPTRDEWDVMPIALVDTRGHGSFFTPIDAAETAESAAQSLGALSPQAIRVFAYNYMDLFPTRPDPRQVDQSKAQAGIASTLIDRYQRVFGGGGPAPASIHVLEGGMGFPPEAEWLGRHAFCVPANETAALLTQRFPRQRFVAPLPGHTERFELGRLVTTEHETAFLSLPERSTWPARGAEPFTGALPDYPPVCGRRDLSADELADLEVELAAFAQFLYGGRTFSRLFSFGDRHVAPRRAAIALRLRTGDDAIHHEYDPRSCRFVRRDVADARAEYVAGLECWATDLLDVLRVELLTGYLLLGRLRTWNAAPDRLELDLVDALNLYNHPLRNPARHLRLYRRTLAELGEAPHRIAARAS